MLRDLYAVGNAPPLGHALPPRGGVATCAGSSCYSDLIDLRYLWIHQKRLQGSHLASDEQTGGIDRLVFTAVVVRFFRAHFIRPDFPGSQVYA